MLEPHETFDTMGLSDALLGGIFAYGYEKPSPIQQRGIVPIVQGRDILAQAQSGTGKTGTFSIGVLSRVDAKLPVCQAIVLSPTRELATQTFNVLNAIGERTDVAVHACIGGTDVRADVTAIKGGAQVIIGTPGRLFQLLDRGTLHIQHLRVLVLDEADQMLGAGFQEQLGEIFSFMPAAAQVALFSATMPAEALLLARQLLRDPVILLVKAEALTLEGLKQYHVPLLDDREKVEVLLDLYDNLKIVQSIIYVNTRRKAEWLASTMEKCSFTVSCIHGELDMRERESIVAEFRGGATRVLIATDLLARGFDVQQVSLVINFEMPPDRENYLHRIGRTARMGRKGSAITFVGPREMSYLRDIETFYNTVIGELPVDLTSL